MSIKSYTIKHVFDKLCETDFETDFTTIYGTENFLRTCSKEIFNVQIFPKSVKSNTSKQQ